MSSIDAASAVQPRALLTSMVEHARLAPSSHNTQPWKFRLEIDRLDLFADRSRSLPVNDPRDRELIISCGAALLNARLAAAHAGAGVVVDLLPEGEGAALLASATLLGGADADEPLFAAIPRRRTHRGPFADRTVSRDVLDVLGSAARQEGAWLELLGDDDRDRFASLVAAGDRAQFADVRWRGELASWMHSRRDGDGLAYPGVIAPLVRFVVRRFDVGDRTAARDRELAGESPVVALLATERDSVADWLCVGQALQRVLLTATAAGLQASYLNQPVQRDELRADAAALLRRKGLPQLALRLGYPSKELPAAPRRPLSALIDDAPR